MNNLNVYEIGADELNGEITNDAVFNRNASLEERFNINIDTLSMDNPSHFEHVNFITNSVLSQDNAFDIASTLVYTVGGMILNNMFLNWKTIPYIELENPWWAKGVNDPFTVDNKLFAAVSDTCISCMRKTNVFLFNKEIAENFQTEDLYSVVEEGRWTLDYVINLTSDIYEDLNANGEKDPDDFFGLTTNTINSLDGFRTGCDQNTLRDTGEGLEIIINTEKMVNIWEKTNQLVYESIGTNHDDFVDLPPFLENRSLLAITPLDSMFGSLREMETDFGILPYPKYDEAQQKYYSHRADDYSVMLIPVTLINKELVGAVSEAMACESNKNVMPAFYEDALKNKYSRDEKSVAMLDLIMDGRVADLSILYTQSFKTGRLAHIIRISLRERTNFTTFYAKNEKLYRKQVDDLYEQLKALGE